MKKLFIFTIIILIQSIFISYDVLARGIHQPKKISLSTGVSMEYVEQGESRENTILFVHGFTDSWHSFESVLKILPVNIHAIAVTLRGHGNSSKQGSSFTIPDFAADLEAFITTKKLKNVVLAGHSLGGLVVQQFALDYPQLTKAVIITSSASSFKDNPGIPEFVAAINEISDPIPYEFASEFQKSTVYKPVNSQQMNLFIAESLKVPAYVWKSVGSSLLEVDYTKDLKRLNKPCLIIWGDKDSVCSKEDQLKLNAVIKDSKLVIYENTGHALHWEDPERFAKDVLSFIKQLPV